MPANENSGLKLLAALKLLNKGILSLKIKLILNNFLSKNIKIVLGPFLEESSYNEKMGGKREATSPCPVWTTRTRGHGLMSLSSTAPHPCPSKF